MGFPRQPEPLAALKVRYPGAVVDLYDQEAVQFSGAKRPGEDRKHVFDFENGLRLLISRERIPYGEIIVHVSASALKESNFVKILEENQKPVCSFAFKAAINYHWQQLSGRTDELELIGFTSAGQVSHWFVKEK